LFDGWYPGADGGGIKVTTTTVVSADTKYYAKWVSVPSDWDYNSTTGGMSRTFEYKGYEQNFTVLVEGSYTFELSGAAGGVNYGRTSLRAKGGFSKGTIKTLPKNTMLYVYVGGRGGDSATSTGTTTAGAGGWNGGGAGGSGVEADSVKYSGGGGGGGATDIRFVSGTDATALKSRIIVAGGGGGLGQDYNSGSTSGNKGKGGAGGGASGGDGFDNGAAAATNAAGGKQDSGNVFGTGATGGNGNNATNSAEGHGGGGGGYYGGKARSTSTGTKQICGGGGGSGFVYGYYSTAGNQSSYPVPAAYQSYRFTSDMACTAGDGSNGNGSAKVTYTPIP
jgi:hypothetical protein